MDGLEALVALDGISDRDDVSFVVSPEVQKLVIVWSTDRGADPSIGHLVISMLDEVRVVVLRNELDMEAQINRDTFSSFGIRASIGRGRTGDRSLPGRPRRRSRRRCE